MIPWLTPASPDRFSDVRDTSLAKLVREDVLGQILRGVLAPGQRINEPDVAQRLQVSRVPVREALRELESSGLVVSRKHSGVFVRELGAGEIRDLYQFRALLDAFVGRSVAALPSKQRTRLIQTLDVSIAAMQEAATSQAVQRYYGENLRFHWAMVEAAGNKAVADAYQGIVQKLHLSRIKNLSKDVGMQTSIQEHSQIVQALKDGDLAQCEALMAQHVGAALERLATHQ